MATRTLMALALAAILGIGAMTATAGAYSCTSYRVGSYVYTNCN